MSQEWKKLAGEGVFQHSVLHSPKQHAAEAALESTADAAEKKRGRQTPQHRTHQLLVDSAETARAGAGGCCVVERRRTSVARRNGGSGVGGAVPRHEMADRATAHRTRRTARRFGRGEAFLTARIGPMRALVVVLTGEVGGGQSQQTQKAEDTDRLIHRLWLLGKVSAQNVQSQAVSRRRRGSRGSQRRRRRRGPKKGGRAARKRER
jgi:hypothetical protein